VIGEEIGPGMFEVLPDPVEPKPEWAWACPKCKAKKGSPCVYVSASWKWVGHYRDEKRIQIHAAGDTTVKSHNERLNRMHNAARTRERTPPVVGPSAAVMAFWAYDRQEYSAMQAWLKENWGIFQ